MAQSCRSAAHSEARIHLLGSEGFIGRALQRQATNGMLKCWSHRRCETSHLFDLLDESTWQPLLSQQPSHVILLSWPGLPNYQESFHLTHNLPACIELVSQLQAAGLRRLVVAGTCYEYGLQNGALREDQVTDPVNSYAIAKDSLRRWISQKVEDCALQWSWLRIFYPYGEGQNPKSLLPSLELALLRGAHSFLMSSGRQIRDFVHVDDVARQLLLLSTHPDALGVYNGGSGQPRSLREIVEARVEALRGEIRLVRGAYPERTDEPLAFWADMTRIHTLQSQS